MAVDLVAVQTPSQTRMGDELNIAAEGFREYDLRWRYPEQIDNRGIRTVGLAFGSWLHEKNACTTVIVGHDSRSYSPEVRKLFASGLVAAGCEVWDIGLALSPMLYFAQIQHNNSAGAMITASHNPNGWTGLKLSASPPLTLGPLDIQELKTIIDKQSWTEREAGRSGTEPSLKGVYVEILTDWLTLQNPLKVVCATGNGTAGEFAPQVLEAIGCEVVSRHTDLDNSFPHYEPNPEAEEMLKDMGEATVEAYADVGLGFDGDGDRCGAVDEKGQPVYSDKLGLLLARHYAPQYPGATFLADVKSTGLFRCDPVLKEHNCQVHYVRTGHAYMKQALQEQEALAGFERAGHFYFGPPLGLGYDDGLLAAIEICKLLDAGQKPLSELVAELPTTHLSPTYQPACDDTIKYSVIERVIAELQQMHTTHTPFAGSAIQDILTVNGARVELDSGDWFLIRASSNTPNLVVIAESYASAARTREICHATAEFLESFPEVDCTVLTQ